MIYWLVISTPLKKYESQFTIIYHSFLSDIDDLWPAPRAECSAAPRFPSKWSILWCREKTHRTIDGCFRMGKSMKPRENMGNSWKFRKKNEFVFNWRIIENPWKTMGKYGEFSSRCMFLYVYS